jgi:hypothetical protein
MSNPICPFSATLVSGDFACRHAEAIIRRGGTEIACRSGSSHSNCLALHRAMKAVALADQGYEDDLTQIPHSLLVKIQYGGLLGLQRIMAGDGEPEAPVSDIDSLVRSAIARFGSTTDVPCDRFCEDMTAYRLPGRRSRKR